MAINLTSSTRLFLMIAALLGATGVGLGAYGAHGLTKWAFPAQIQFYNTAVLYQLLHAISLLGVAILSMFIRSRLIIATQILFCLGILFFSGPLYLYVFSGVKILGAITPVGGLLLIIAWLLFFIAIFKTA